jgi:hypothetical protein
MSSCPNVNSAQWKNLVATLGNEGAAHAVYNANKFEIPETAEIAQEILGKILSGKKEDSFSDPKIKKLKLDRINEQISIVERVMKGIPKDARYVTLQKVINNLITYKKIVENEEATISVSKLTGGAEIDNSEKYKNYERFGTFLHYVVESLQKETVGGSLSLTSAFNEKKLKELLDAYPNKFDINGLIQNGDIVNMPDLYNMVNELLGVMQHYSSMGYILLPEISLVGKDRKGRNIVGRLDIAAIDPNGKMSVLDIKSKKMNSAVNGDPFLKEYPVASIPDLTDPRFASGTRNVYANWDIQLGIYARLIQQADITPDQRVILAVMYKGDYMNPEGTGKQFDSFGTDTFQYTSYKVRSYVSSENNQVNERDYLSFKNNMAKVEEVVPFSTTTNEKKSIPEEDRDSIIFNMTEDEAKKLVNKLDSITNEQINIARRKIKEAKKKDADQKVVDYFEERILNLSKIKEIIKQEGAKWESAYKIGFILRALEIDMQNLARTVSNFERVFNQKDLASRTRELEKLNSIAVGYNEFINALEDLLINSDVNRNSKAINTIGDIKKNINIINSVYNQLGFRHMFNFLQDSMSGIQIERINDERKQVLEAEIRALEKRKEKLLAGDPDVKGIWFRISQRAKSIMRPDITPQTEIENIELKIEKLKLEMEGIKVDDESVQKYIYSVLDPKSPLYIGEGTTFFTQVVAGSSSADWALSSYANQLKIALANGSKEFINFIEREKIQQEFDKYKGFETNMLSLNERISEIRTELSFDENNNESTVDVKAFVNPLSQEYINTFDRYYNELDKFDRMISEETDKEKVKELRAQKRGMMKDHLNWRLQNTQMRFVNQIYELDKLLPEEYKEKRDSLLKEKSMLEQSAGFNNMDRLDEETLFQIDRIQHELNKLRLEYISKEGGTYKNYLTMMDKYYTYETNQNYFDRLYNQKVVEFTDPITGQIDQEALAKWKAQNTVKKPKEEWHETISDIWGQIFDIIGTQNPKIEKLREEYNEILSQYRNRGIVDSRFMSDEDVQAIDEIEELMASYKSTSQFADLTYPERIRLNQLFRDLEYLQKKVENPFYRKEFDLQLEELDQAWDSYLAEKDPKLKDFKLEQFSLKEVAFKDWYDKNHTNKYTSRLLSEKALNPLPRKFNMLTVPASEDLVEEKPDYKFTIKKLRPTAYNINYQEDVEGYPLPIGLEREGARIDGLSPWLNPKYEEIRNNPKDSEFYHSFVGRFLDVQEETVGQHLGYKFPGYEEQSLMDVNANGVVDAFKNRLKMFRDKNLIAGTEYDFSINNFRTNVEDRIQFKHNKTLPIEQQTSDGISAVLRWYENAFVNKAMAEVQPMSKATISFMESLYEKLAISQFPGKEKRMVQLRRVIDGMKFEYDKFVKGEWKKDEGVMARYGDLLLKGIGFTRLALDIPNQLGNMISGNVQAFLGSHKSGLYSTSNYMWAVGKIVSKNGLIGSLMKDYGKFGNRSFMTNMFLYWNPLQQSSDHYYNRTRTGADRLKQGFADGNFLFWIQDKGEMEVGSTIWLSIMDNIKVKVVAKRDENGNVLEYAKDQNGNIEVVNVFDAYTQNENGEIVIRPDVEWTQKDEKYVQQTVWSEIRRTQGKYAEWDKSKIESGFIGRLLLFYRKYLEPAIRNRFGRRETNWEAGTVAYGFYRGLIKSIRVNGSVATIRSIFGSSEEKTGVSEYYQRKSQMAAREMAVSASLYFLGLLIKGALPDDDEDDMNWLARTALLNLVAVYSKVDMETRSLVPLPIFGDMDSYIQQFGSLTNANRDVARIGSLLDHGIFLGLSTVTDNEYIEKKAYYQKKSGYFEKGDAKIRKDIADISGYMNIYDFFYPETRVKNNFVRK